MDELRDSFIAIANSPGFDCMLDLRRAITVSLSDARKREVGVWMVNKAFGGGLGCKHSLSI